MSSPIVRGEKKEGWKTFGNGFSSCKLIHSSAILKNEKILHKADEIIGGNLQVYISAAPLSSFMGTFFFIAVVKLRLPVQAVWHGGVCAKLRMWPCNCGSDIVGNICTS